MRVTAECAKLEARGSMVLGHDAHEAAHAFPKPLPRRGVTSVDAARGGLSLRAVQPEAQSASVRGGWSKAGAASWSEIGRQQPDADGASTWLLLVNAVQIWNQRRWPNHQKSNELELAAVPTPQSLLLA